MDMGVLTVKLGSLAQVVLGELAGLFRGITQAKAGCISFFNVQPS